MGHTATSGGARSALRSTARKNRTAPGFTLVEIMVAVAILALVSVAALRLAAISQRTLEEVQVQRRLLDETRALQVIQRAGTLPDSGKSGDLSWNLLQEEMEIPNTGVQIPYKRFTVTLLGRTLELWVP